MGYSLLLFPILALALGFKHAYDADHLVAVSNFLTRSRGIGETSRMTVSWALGHMVTAAIITVVLFVLASEVNSLTGLLSNLDVAVGVMLVAVGVVGVVFRVPMTHEHAHTHGNKEHVHTHVHRYGGLSRYTRKAHFHHPLFEVGIVHGLASNDELISLFVAGLGVGSLEVLLGGVAVFTVGVVLGMTLFGIMVTLPLLKYDRIKVQSAINLVAGSISMIYGAVVIAGFAGFNLFDFFSGFV